MVHNHCGCNNVKFLLEFLKRNKKLSTQHVFLNKERDITLQFNQVKTTKFVTSINVEQPPSDFINLNLCYCWTNNNLVSFLYNRGIKLTAIAVIGTNYIGRCKSIYHIYFTNLIKYKFEQNLFYLH